MVDYATKVALACPVGTTQGATDLISGLGGAVEAAEALLGRPLVEDCVDEVTGEIVPLVVSGPEPVANCQVRVYLRAASAALPTILPTRCTGGSALARRGSGVDPRNFGLWVRLAPCQSVPQCAAECAFRGFPVSPRTSPYGLVPQGTVELPTEFAPGILREFHHHPCSNIWSARTRRTCVLGLRWQNRWTG